MDSYLAAWHFAYAAIVVPIVLGNGLIILSISRYKCLRTKMHVLIGNLAISDLIVGLVLIPCDLVGDMIGLHHNKMYCLSKLTIFVVSMGGSCFSLLLISIKRLITIAYPLAQHYCLTKCKIGGLLIIGWTYVLMTGAPPIIGWNQYNDNQTECNSDEIYTIGYQYFLNIQFVVVLICNIVMYAIVMRIALKTAKGNQLEDGMIIHTRSDRDLQKLKMMVTILGLFIVCWSPYAVVVTILLFYDNQRLRFARKCSIIPGIVNSALNWIVYGYRNKDFRSAFKEMIKCQEKGHSVLTSMSRRQAVAALSLIQSVAQRHHQNISQSNFDRNRSEK